jgi:hypothetical protein
MRPVDKSEVEWKLRRLTGAELSIGKVAAKQDLIAWYGVMLCEKARRCNCLGHTNSYTRFVRDYRSGYVISGAMRDPCRTAAAEYVPLRRLIHEGAYGSLLIAGTSAGYLRAVWSKPPSS